MLNIKEINLKLIRVGNNWMNEILAKTCSVSRGIFTCTPVAGRERVHFPFLVLFFGPLDATWTAFLCAEIQVYTAQLIQLSQLSQLRLQQVSPREKRRAS